MTLVDSSTGKVIARRTFAENEAEVERGFGTFVRVGEALREIRDARQYIEGGWSSFDSYLDERWGMKRAHAYRLIESAEIVGQLSPIGDTHAPATESQARALAPLRDDPQAMAEVMEEVAAESGRVTAEKISDKVAEKIAERVAEAAAVRAEAEASVEEFKALQPADFDPVLNRELIRQRGEVYRLCRDLAAIGDPVEFVERHHGFLTDDHHAVVTAAAAWLAELDRVMKENR